MKFWFSMDEICARINELKRQCARGAEINEGHLAEIAEMADRLRRITDHYDTAPRT